jgi:hypothetical protein
MLAGTRNNSKAVKVEDDDNLFHRSTKGRQSEVIHFGSDDDDDVKADKYDEEEEEEEEEADDLEQEEEQEDDDKGADEEGGAEATSERNEMEAIQKYINEIYYSPRYYDDTHEYRHVTLPRQYYHNYVPDVFKNRK